MLVETVNAKPHAAKIARPVRVIVLVRRDSFACWGGAWLRGLVGIVCAMLRVPRIVQRVRAIALVHQVKSVNQADVSRSSLAATGRAMLPQEKIVRHAPQIVDVRSMNNVRADAA